MLVPHVIENISNLKLLTTPNEDAISQTLLLNRASNALQTHISATLIAPLDSQAAREYNESLNNNIRFLFCGGGGDIFYSGVTSKNIKTLNQKSRTKKDRQKRSTPSFVTRRRRRRQRQRRRQTRGKDDFDFPFRR